MKQIIIIMTIMLLSAGCRIIPRDFTKVNGVMPETADNKCQELYIDIIDIWAENKEFPKCHHYDKKLMDSINANKKCFIGKTSKSDLVRLFGEQYYAIDRNNPLSNMEYYMANDICQDYDTTRFSDWTLKFIFYNNGKVKYVSLYKKVAIE